MRLAKSCKNYPEFGGGKWTADQIIKCPSLTRPKFSPRIASALRETRSISNLPWILCISRGFRGDAA